MTIFAWPNEVGRSLAEAPGAGTGTLLERPPAQPAKPAASASPTTQTGRLPGQKLDRMPEASDPSSACPYAGAGRPPTVQKS
jgi:hypothetical protein